MTAAHINEICVIEEESFSTPWSRGAFERELKSDFAYYFAALDENGAVAGYCGLWHVVNEGHITNIAVKPGFRNRGVGSMLVEKLISFAVEKEMLGLTLEVRMGNRAAFALYNRYGFKPEGIRKEYYGSGEDAVIMWKYF